MNEELKIIISAEIDKLKTELKNAQSQVQGFTNKSESSLGKFGKAAGAAGKVVAKGLAVAGAAIVAAGAALVGLAESTREYRTEQAKLQTAFLTAGASAEAASTTYNSLYRVLGDSGQATEAANHLAQLTTNEQDLAEWTRICQGAYATFGDSMPIESLTEAANETAKTGEITGALADAINWAGMSEADFAAELLMCNSEAEREKLIRSTLTGLYGEAADQYEVTAASILSANEAQAALTEGLAALGAAVEPIITVLKAGLAGTLMELVPSFQTLSQGIQDMVSGVEGGAEKMSAGVSSMISTIFEKIMGALPAIAGIIPQIIDILGDLIPQITEGLLNSLPLIIDTVLKAVAQILQVLAKILPEIVMQIVEIIPQIIDTILDNIPALLDAAITFLMAIVEAIPKIIPPLVDSLPGIVDNIINTLLENLPVLMEAGITLFRALVDAIPQIIPSIVQALPKIIASIIGGLIQAIPMIAKGAFDLFKEIPGALKKIIPSLLQGAKDLVSNLKTALVDKLKSLFKFEWNLPKLKVPKFSITPSGWGIGDLLKGSIPKLSVTWNARGGVFDEPTLFSYGNSLQGLGENGAEAVVPLENNLEWLDKLANMLANRLQPAPVYLQVDGKTFGKVACDSINKLTKQTGTLPIKVM